MGLLGVEILLDGLGWNSVSRVWCIAGKGLAGVAFVWAGT